MVDACKRHACGNNLLSFGAVKYLTNPENRYVAGLMRRIQWCIYSSAVKSGLETTFPALEHKKATKMLLGHSYTWTLSGQLRIATDAMSSNLVREPTFEWDSLEDFLLNKKWLLDPTSVE